MRLLASLVAILIASPFVQAYELLPLTNEQVADDLKEVVRNVRAYYGPLQYKTNKFGFNLDAEAAKAEQEILAAKSEGQAIAGIARFLGKLSDGHVNIWFPNYTSQTSESRIPIFVTPIEGKAIVASVDASITNLGIEVGDELISVDDVPSMDFAKKVTEFKSFGNPKSNQHFVYHALHRQHYMHEFAPTKKAAWLSVMKANGKQLRVQATWRPKALHDTDVKFVGAHSSSYFVQGSVEYNQAVGAASFLAMGSTTPFYLSEQAKAKFRITRVRANEEYLEKYKLDPKNVPDVYAAMMKYNDKDILVVRMATYLPGVPWEPYIANYKAILDQYEPFADVLVVDQTHNPGGDSNYLEAFLRLFVKERAASAVNFLRADREWIREFEKNAAKVDPKLESELARNLLLRARIVEDAQKKGEFLTSEPLAMNWANEIDPNTDYSWKKPILVLIDELAGSCGDIFPMVVKRNNIGKLFGEATMGLGGNVVPFPKLTYTGAEYRLTRGLFAVYRPDGKYTDADFAENNGQQPDYPHTITLADFRAGYVGYVEAFAKAAVEQIEAKK